MQKDLKYGILLSIYGNFLTERQKDIMTAYYDEDFSLAEISENLSISRQAVLDALHIGCTALDKFENELKILSTKEYLLKQMEKLCRVKDKPEEIEKIAEEIENKI